MGFFDLTIGATLLGTFFNTFLYGLVIYQFSSYHQTKFNDPAATRYMVFFLFILDTFHSASAVYMAWNYTVTNYNNPTILEMNQWTYTITPICTALTALVTNTYLGFRIWRLTNSKILFGMVIVLVIASFILGFTCGIEVWIVQIFSKLPSITPLVIGWLTVQVVVDALITTTLVIIFSRSRTGFRRTDTVLNRLIRGAIQTGLFAVIFTLGDLICFLVLPNTTLSGMFAVPTGRIYTNTLLAGLLSRPSLKAELYATYDMSKELGSINWGTAHSSQASSELQSAGSQRQIQRSFQQLDDPSARGNAQSGRPVAEMS